MSYMLLIVEVRQLSELEDFGGPGWPTRGAGRARLIRAR